MRMGATIAVLLSTTAGCRGNERAVMIPAWVRSVFPDTGSARPVFEGGPVFSSVKSLGEWRTETRTVQAVWVGRVIPEMRSPRGMNVGLLVDARTREVLL